MSRDPAVLVEELVLWLRENPTAAVSVGSLKQRAGDGKQAAGQILAAHHWADALMVSDAAASAVADGRLRTVPMKGSNGREKPCLKANPTQ